MKIQLKNKRRQAKVRELYKRFKDSRMKGYNEKLKHLNLLQRRKEFEGLNYMIKMRRLHQNESCHI